MSNQCFYCQYEIDNQKLHVVSFYNVNQECEEVLCPECYREWLEGIKE
ncbi:hypothetical protein [Bacillus taeanensis]|nr:hypothetical protein [Bacillus taeanensis]